MQYSQEHLKTMVYAEFGGQTECIMGNWKIENANPTEHKTTFWARKVSGTFESYPETPLGSLRSPIFLSLFPQSGAWSEATVTITHQYQSQFGYHGGEPGRNWTS